MSSEGLAKVLEDPMEWKKILDESSGLCDAMVRANTESKKLLALEISNLNCEPSGASWLLKTSHGEERISIESIPKGIRFQTSLYSLEISRHSTGLFFSQPKAVDGTPLAVRDLKTNQMANFYSKNLALCSKPNGA